MLARKLPLSLSNNVWQAILQTNLSKITVPPEGASDVFANNFDQIEEIEEKHHLSSFLKRGGGRRR